MAGRSIPRQVLLKKSLYYFIFLAIAVLSCFFEVYADDTGRVKVYLKNRDRLSGELVEEDKERIVLDHEIFGRLEISRESIDRISAIKPAAADTKEKKIWTREISAGYILTRGNTNRGSVSGDLKFNRKTKNSEFTLKTNGYYAASDKKMDAQRYSGMLRYARSFGRSRRWHNFYKFEGDHDRFANIDYRLIHSLGSGFWFSDTSEWKAKAELGMGYEHVVYRNDRKDKNETLLIPGIFLEKSLFCRSRVSQECSFFLPFDEFEEYRIYSESSLINPLNECLSLKFSLINEYDAAAAEGVKKHDLRFISVLKYDF
jgi:putative salt-induced outer membrane protein YdiY